MARLIAALPKGEANGLAVLDQPMVSDPETPHLIVALVEQRAREQRRVYTADRLGHVCVVCGTLMVAALEAEGFNCHPACDPRELRPPKRPVFSQR